VTQEFHISVTPVGNDEYLVRTETVAPGVPLAEEQLSWQVEEWLTQARQLMSDPLLGLLQSDRPASSGDASALQTSLSLVNLGQQLYSALFQGTLRDSWVIAQGIAQNRREALRLRLGLKGSRLPRLPWEVMYGNDIPAETLQQGLNTAARPLAAGTHLIFSRYQPSQRLLSDRLVFAIDTALPLRILMVIAAPDDQERLQLHQEAKRLQQELSTQLSANLDISAASPEIQLTILDQPGREQLTQALEQGHYQVLHYAGHSDLSSGGGSLYLVNHRTGLSEILSGDDLAGLLVNNGIRLAVFNSCRGAYTATSDAVNERERNLAEALVSRGIPAVLAMAEQIPDNVALTLTWLFYRNLKQGYPIDLSLSRARQGLISAYGSHQLYWALPILYLHHEFDGYLTPSDRTFDNPADRLMLMPHGGNSFPVLTIDENTPLPASFLIDDSPIPTDEEMVASAVLSEEDDLGDWMEDLEAFNDTDEAETLDWIRQLTSQVAEETSLEMEADTHESHETQPDLEPQVGMAGNSPLWGISAVGASALYQFPAVTESVANAASEEVTFHPVSTEPASDSVMQENPTALSQADEMPTGMVQAISIDRPLQTDSSKQPKRPQTVHSGERSSRRVVLLPVLGAVSAIAIAFLGYSLTQSTQINLLSEDPLSEDTAQVSMPGNQEESFSQRLTSSSTEQVKAIALSSFGKRRLAQGQQAVQVLLDREALPEAETVLEAIPEEYQNQAEVNFLQGRLAWQSVQKGEIKYTLTDVRQAWEKAAQEEPNSAFYQQALGFVYYAEGKSLQARQIWMQALSLTQSSQVPKAHPISTHASETPASETQSTGTAQRTMDQNTLMAYAGVALALRHISANQPSAEQENISGKAAKIYQMVMTSDPENFSAKALRQNWLWSEAAIHDWEKLGKLQP
jgi:tetratricopeptide (TPR) repeat protein